MQLSNAFRSHEKKYYFTRVQFLMKLSYEIILYFFFRKKFNLKVHIITSTSKPLTNQCMRKLYENIQIRLHKFIQNQICVDLLQSQNDLFLFSNRTDCRRGLNRKCIKTDDFYFILDITVFHV